MKKLYLSWEQVEKACVSFALQMYKDNWKPDIIVGITRGGAIPAVMLSHLLGIKMVGLDVSLRDSAAGPESNCWLAEDALAGKKILVVDDINDTGATINWIKNDWESSVCKKSIEWGFSTRFATLVDNESSRAIITPSYTSQYINKAESDVWVVFPWENSF